MTGQRFSVFILAAGLWAGASAFAQTAPMPTPSRGELLYGNHCITCHSSQIHWRDKRLVSDWPSLKLQVQRWQGAASLGWSEADIVEVARHLNATIYRFPPLGNRVGDAGRSGNQGQAEPG